MQSKIKWVGVYVMYSFLFVVFNESEFAADFIIASARWLWLAGPVLVLTLGITFKSVFLWIVLTLGLFSLGYIPGSREVKLCVKLCWWGVSGLIPYALLI